VPLRRSLGNRLASGRRPGRALVAALGLSRVTNLAIFAKMKPQAITIGQLRDQLSAYLQGVRRGRDVIVLDRDKPVARIVAYTGQDDLGAGLAGLVAEGLVKAPESSEPLPRRRRGKKAAPIGDALLDALTSDRDEAR